jgi:hypothetical protein
MSAVEKPGFEIEGRRYPFPESFRLGDPVLVAELTGMSFPEFAEALDDPDRREDPAILIGLIGVAVWQGNPRWRRDKVIAYVQQIDLGEFEAFGGGAEDEQLPPAEPAQEPADETSDQDISPESSSESNDSAD